MTKKGYNSSKQENYLGQYTGKKYGPDYTPAKKGKVSECEAPQRIKAQCGLEIMTRVYSLQRDLCHLFELASKRRIGIDELYTKGVKIRETLTKSIPVFWDRANSEDLKDALEFIDNLHDVQTRKYHSKDRTQVRAYAIKLAKAH